MRSFHFCNDHRCHPGVTERHAIISSAMNIYLSSSWKNRDRVRALAIELRSRGHTVYDFTDKDCRPENAVEIPPEKFPAQFDPANELYGDYISRHPEWKAAVMSNKKAIEDCDVVILMLPCGNDAHADAYYGLGLGKHLVVCGQPKAGDRTPTHLWADAIVPEDKDVLHVILHRRSG